MVIATCEKNNLKQLKIGVVLEFEDDSVKWIKQLRDSIDESYKFMPLEITLSGSSGIGHIEKDQPFELICSELYRVLGDLPKTNVSFKNKLGSFPSTEIFFLQPQNQDFFVTLNKKLAESEIKFSKTPFPYLAHCTVYNGNFCEKHLTKDLESTRKERRKSLEATEIKEAVCVLRCASVYQYNIEDETNPIIQKLFEIPFK